MWWFAASHRNLLMLSQGRVSLEPKNRPILDAGCGTGGFLVKLATWYPDRTLLGLDADQQACKRAATKSARPVCAGSVDALPFPDGVFAVIFSADVLCHRNVDEQGALRQFRRCLAESGWLILNLPAYHWMLSGHDSAVHNTRRYTTAKLARLLKATGFRLIYSTYWNSLLFPFMVVSRKLFFSQGYDGGQRGHLAPSPSRHGRSCRDRPRNYPLASGVEVPVRRVGSRNRYQGRRCRWLTPTIRTQRQYLVSPFL